MIELDIALQAAILSSHGDNTSNRSATDGIEGRATGAGRVRRLIAPGLLALLALAGLGYGLYWHIAARTLEDGIQRWAAERRAEGYDISFTEPRITGFPFRLEARIGDPAIAAPPEAGAWRWRGPALRGEAAPWRPLRIHLTMPGAHTLSWEIDGRQRSLEAVADAAEGTVELAADGRLETLDVALADLVVGMSGGSDDRITVARATAGATLSGRASDGDATAFRLALRRVILPADGAPPLGREIDRIEADGTLAGRFSAGPPDRALAAWRDDGGTLELRRLTLEWGPLRLSGDGTFALDEAMRPLAAMTATISGHGETIDALVEDGVVPPREGGIARLLLTALSERPKDGGPPQLTVAVTAQDGYLHVGPVRLIPLPAIRWP